MGDTLSDIPDYGNLGPNIDTSGFGQFTPAYAGGTDTTGVGGGANWGQVAKALSQLQGAGGQQGKAVANLPGAALPAMARPNTGVPAHAEALSALLQMLNQRRDMYLNAATNPQSGAVQQGPPAAGLLGV